MSAPGPDGLLAVAALQRCLERRDYAGAARLITARPLLDGLRTLTGSAGLAGRQKALERDLRDVVALLVSALADSECTGEWSCLHCGAVEAKAAEWPAIQRGAA